MRVLFDELKKVSSMNDKKENVKFLLSDRIISSSNKLVEHDFYILKDKYNRIYIDKNIITNIKNELKIVVDSYTKNNPEHLKKIDKAKSKEKKSNSDGSPLDKIKDTINCMIDKTNSTPFKNKIFNAENRSINILLEKNRFSGVKVKSANKLVEKLKDKTIELNKECNFPFELNDNNMVLVKLGNMKIASNNVEVKKEIGDENIINNNFGINKENKSNCCKVNLLEFEMLFNFLDDNIKKLYKTAVKYNKFLDLEKNNHFLNFESDNKELSKNIRELLQIKNGILFSAEKSCEKYSYFHNNYSNLNLFHQNYVDTSKSGILEGENQHELLENIKKIESNKESLDWELKQVKPFSDLYDEYEIKIKKGLSNLVPSDKKVSCDSIGDVRAKLKECENLIDTCLKIKKKSFLFKAYSFLFFWKKDNSTNLKEGIIKLSSYLDSYEKIKHKYFSINEVCLIATSRLSKMNNPKGFISYLYGERNMWKNFKESLFKKDE
ncbi:hypothetical protein [Proteus hauseri]|uniref:hypothetical protein n=1 Tax=Proteus hauseri TaxID=183417 RepID=UPI0032DAA4B2